MPVLTRLDVLIVYNGKFAASATDLSAFNTTPFRALSRHESCNIAYSYFLEICHKFKLKAAFSTSKDIIGAGMCQGYWTYDHSVWRKVNKKCYSNLIFDKYSPTSALGKTKRKLLFSSPSVVSYNSKKLFNLFFDKQKTYDTLPSHSIPTISIDNHSIASIKLACNMLTEIIKSHPYSKDFSTDIIMKDRFGAGGNQIYKFKSGNSADMSTIMKDNSNTAFIIQPFAKFDQGFTLKKTKVSTDIRLVYLGDKIVDSYIRTACPGDFRCNQHQGGTLTYLSLGDIPTKVLSKSNSIASFLNKKNSLYSLDFIVSNNGNPYLLEGNSGPGLDWNTSVEIENINARKFIRTIIDHLAIRAKTKQLYRFID